MILFKLDQLSLLQEWTIVWRKYKNKCLYVRHGMILVISMEYKLREVK